MADNGSILVTGAAGQVGAVGRTVTDLLLERGLPVRAMVRRHSTLGYLSPVEFEERAAHSISGVH